MNRVFIYAISYSLCGSITFGYNISSHLDPDRCEICHERVCATFGAAWKTNNGGFGYVSIVRVIAPNGLHHSSVSLARILLLNQLHCHTDRFFWLLEKHVWGHTFSANQICVLLFIQCHCRLCRSVWWENPSHFNLLTSFSSPSFYPILSPLSFFSGSKWE